MDSQILGIFMARVAPRAAAWRTAWRALLVAVLLVPFAVQAQLRILNPLPGETVHSNAGNVEVVVDGAPADARLTVVLDGEVLDEKASPPSLTLRGLERGTHRLSVAAVDASGTVLGRTEEVEFYVWQASRLFPNRSN